MSKIFSFSASVTLTKQLTEDVLGTFQSKEFSTVLYDEATETQSAPPFIE